MTYRWVTSLRSRSWRVGAYSSSSTAEASFNTILLTSSAHLPSPCTPRSTSGGGTGLVHLFSGPDSTLKSGPRPTGESLDERTSAEADPRAGSSFGRVEVRGGVCPGRVVRGPERQGSWGPGEWGCGSEVAVETGGDPRAAKSG